jgi:WD40 repeat protein/tRNA A-37 threonylcarbamoyl transferase component Bud32
VTDTSGPGLAGLSPEQARAVDDVCNRFEAAWRAGNQPDLQEAVAGLDPELLRTVLAELVLLDAYYRGQAGEQPTDVFYRTRFPDLDSAWLADALADARADGQPALPAALRDHPRYRIFELLGRGGMGAVYRAEHRLIQRPVALKVLSRALADRPDMVERFVAEMLMAARLFHPNIVQVFDAEEAQGTHFFAMELVAGTDLAGLVKRGPLPVHAACDHVRQAALGLQHAYEHGMTHRDIKPHNLMLAEDGTVKVLDFGVARLAQAAGAPTEGGTDARMLLGSADYMAPEQADDPRAADTRSDIYALGCTLFHLLAGRVPFPVPTLARKLRAHAEDQPVPLDTLRPEVPAELAAVVARMMAKDPAKRYATPAEVAAALAPFARATTPPTTTMPRRRRSRSYLMLAIALLLLAAGAATVACVVYRIQTDVGELTITVDNADVEVLVKQNGKVVEIVDTKTNKRIKLAPGEYDLGLLPADGLRLKLDRVTITRGKETIAIVERVAKPARASPAEPAFDPPPGLVWFLNALSGPIHKPALSADGRYLAVAPARPGRGTGVIYSMRTREEIRQFPSCGLVTFVPDGDAVVSNVEPDRLALLNIAPGKEQIAFAGAQPGMMDIDVAADGRFVLGISKAASTLWDATTGAVLDQRRWRAYFSHNARHVVGFDVAGDHITVTERDGGKLVQKFDIKQGYAGHALMLLPGDRTLLRCNSTKRRVELWDMASGAVTEPIDLGPTWINEDQLPAAVSADGKRLLTSHRDGRVRLWELAGGKEIWKMPVDMDVRGLSFSRDGRFAVAGTTRGMVYVWRLPDGPPYPPPPTMDRTLPDGTREHTWNVLVHHTAYAPDGKHYLATGDGSNQVRIWDDETGKLVRVLPGKQWAEFHPDSKHVLAVQQDHSVILWELATGRSVRRFEGHTANVSSFDLSRDGRRLLTHGGDSTLRLWDFETAKQLDATDQPFGKTTWRVVFAPDGKQAATHTEGQAVRLWNVADDRFRLVRRWDLPAGERCGPVRFTADGSELVMATNRQVRWHTASADKPVRTLPLEGYEDAWTHWWALSGDARRLTLMTRQGGALRVLELPSGRELARFAVSAELTPPVGSPFAIAALSSDGRWLVAPARHGNRDLARVYRYLLPAK